MRSSGGAPTEAFGEGARRHSRHGTCQHDAVTSDGGQSPLDDLIDLLDLEPIEVNIFRGALTRREASACVRRTGRRPSTRRGCPHRRPRPRRRSAALRPLAARVLPAARRSEHADPLRGRPHPRRALVHHPARRRDPARQGDLQPARRASTSTRTGLDHQIPMPRACPARRRSPTSRRAWRRTRTRSATTTTARDRSTSGTPTAVRVERGESVAPFQRVWMRADGRLPGRSRAARVRRHVRVRHDAARHHAPAPRRAPGRTKG